MVLPERITKLFSIASCVGFFVTFVAIFLLPAEKLYMIHTGDFPGFYVLAEIVKRGPLANLYSLDLQVQIQHEFFPALKDNFNPSLYPPWTALLLYPLSFFSVSTAKIIFCTVNFIFLLGAFFSLSATQERDEKLPFSIIPILLMCAPVFSSLFGAQNSGITIGILCMSFFLQTQQSDFSEILSGITTGMLLYKPQYGVFAAAFFFLISNRKLFFTLGFTITSCLLLSSSLYFFPLEIWQTYLKTLNLFDGVNLQVNFVEAISLRAVFEIFGGIIAPQYTSLFQKIGNFFCFIIFVSGAVVLIKKKLSLSSSNYPHFHKNSFCIFLLLLPLFSPQTLWYDLTIPLFGLLLIPTEKVVKVCIFSYLLIFSFFCLYLKDHRIPLSFLPFYITILFCATVGFKKSS